MGNQPLVSVIVPVYNVAPYLPFCLDSLTNQTHQKLEIILVDDGSTDGSSRICDRYAGKDSRIKVIHKENGGPSDARNKGIEAATGAYLSFVDSDDYVDEAFIERLMDLVQDYDSDVAACFSNKVSEHGLRKPSAGRSRTYCLSNLESLSWLMETEQGKCPFSVSNKLFCFQLFDDIQFPVGRYYEDAWVIHRLFYKANRVAVTTEKLYYYYKRAGSICNSRYSIKKLDQLHAHVSFLEFLQSKGLDVLAKRAEVMVYRIQKAHFGKLIYFNTQEARQVANEIRMNIKKKTFSLLFNRYRAIADVTTLILILICPSLFLLIFRRRFPV